MRERIRPTKSLLGFFMGYGFRGDTDCKIDSYLFSTLTRPWLRFMVLGPVEGYGVLVLLIKKHR